LTGDWVYSSEASQAIGSSVQSQQLEKTFYYDLDGLNGISNPVNDRVNRTTVQSSAASISGTSSDQFYIALSSSGIVTVAGGGGSDVYQLYNSAGVQFASSSGSDFMAITDFAQDDKIVLVGSQPDYVIRGSGDSLYYIAGGANDLIATISGTALTSSQLVFTTL
jgi:hypothetical protein